MSIGEALASARLRAGLTVAQVSQRTRIRQTIVRDIERDDFSACGGDFYARGHIRAIARVTGLDPEPLVREYDSSRGIAQAGIAAGEKWPSAPLRIRERRAPNRGVALLVMLALAAGLIVYHVVTSHAAGRAAAGPPAAAHKAARKHSAATSTGTPPAAREVTITLTSVSEACWADLTTSSGVTIYEGIVNPGASMTWVERQAVSLRLGNPAAVTLTVDGRSRTGLGSAPVTLNLGPGQGVPG